MRVRSSPCLLALALVASACAGPPARPLAAPRPLLGPVTRPVSAPLPPPDAPSCLVAARLRARVPKSVEGGWLDRALREMDRADGLCPSTARETLATKVRVCVELGELGLARGLVPKLAALSDLTRSERDLLTYATATLAAELARKAPDEATKRAARARATRGVEAYERGDFATAKTELRGAWQVLRPEGEVLRLGTQAALDEAHGAVTPEIRRGFDRALHELEATTGGRVALDTPNGLMGAWDRPDPERSYSGRIGYSSSVVWSREGRWIAVGAARTISVVDVATRRIVARLEGHDGPVLSVALSPDGKTLASSSDDGTVRLWNVAGDPRRSLHWGNPLRVLKEENSDYVEAVAFSPDGQTVAAGGGSSARLWSLNGRLLRTLGGHSYSSVAFSPGGTTLLTASIDSVSLWDLRTPSGREMPGGGARAAQVAFAPDGQTLASGGESLKLWRVTGEPLRTLAGDDMYDMFQGVAYSPDGKMLAAGGSAVRVWQPADVSSAARVLGHGRASSVAFSPDSRFLATSDGRSVSVFVAASRESYTVEPHTAPVYALALAPDGRLAVGEAEGVRMWAPASASGGALRRLGGSTERQQPTSAPASAAARLTEEANRLAAELSVSLNGNVIPLAFSPDGKKLASGLSDGSIRLWREGVPETLRGRGSARSLAFSPDGKTLASGSSLGPVQLWDVAGAKARLARDLGGRGAAARTVALSADAKTVASGHEDGFVRLWSVSGALLRKVEPGRWPTGLLRSAVASVAFSPDGKALAACDNGVAPNYDPPGPFMDVSSWRVWDVAALRSGSRAPPTGSLVDFSHMAAVAFLGDGRTLAVAGESPGRGGVDLWDHQDLERSDPLRTLGGRASTVTSFAASTDGKTLVAGSPSGDTEVYSPATGAHRGTLRAVVDSDAAYVFTSEAIDFYGTSAATAREYPVCRIGGQGYPFELCAGRFETPELLRVVLLGESLDSVL